MPHSTLTPVFVGLRTGLHALVAALLGLVVVRAVVVGGPDLPRSLVLAAVFGGIYLLGARINGVWWLALLTLAWLCLLVTVPEGAYLAFPLFFCYLHLLPRWVGPIAVVVSAGAAIVAIGAHRGYTVGGVVGPIVGAGVAVLIGLGYRALARESAEREALLAELVATREELARTEHEQGVLAERSRLAREIHDTVAQGLSSIQMLLHAAERADDERPGIEHVRLARHTAAEGLAETRRFIAELTPPTLDQGVELALERLAASQGAAHGLRFEVDAGGTSSLLPIEVQTALLRIAQGAVANIVQHAAAQHVWISLKVRDSQAQLVIRDDGVGFDPDVDPEHTSRSPASTSFGLRAITERVEQLGGTLDLRSAPGQGTTLAVTVPQEGV